MTEEATQEVAQEAPSVEVDGTKYLISDLSDTVQQLIAMHQEWSVEAQEAAQEAQATIREAQKIANQKGAAVKHLENQIVAQIRAEAATSEEEAPTS